MLCFERMVRMSVGCVFVFVFSSFCVTPPTRARSPEKIASPQRKAARRLMQRDGRPMQRDGRLMQRDVNAGGVKNSTLIQVVHIGRRGPRPG